jgi:parvulin-like peptidyl-prolyl isomerase
MILIGTSAHTFWAIGLSIGFGAAVVAAILLTILVSTVDRIDRSVKALLGVAGQVAGNTEYIPQLHATAPVLGQIQDEVLVLDDYMNALTDGFGGR